MAQAAVKEAPFQNSLRRMLHDDDKNCKLLVAAYEKAATCAQKNILVEDHVLEFDPNFFNKVEKGIADLNKVDRQILVIGESSAGKSSFLNLLLERKVLPQRAAPCTRCFCCIKKGPNLEARITSFGCSTPSKIINGNDMTDEEFRDELEGLMNADNCLQALDRCIDVVVPSNILQDKVYLVDSAGFGESEQITRSLVKYLPKAIGIIFILNSTVGLGISEDRGALILDEIKLLAKKGDIPSFDPRQVVFIANKWDQIDKTERKDHRKKMIKKLETSWPNFQEDQLLPLSVNYVWDTHENPGCVHANYMSATTDYRNVLDKIRATVQHCANARSSIHTRFLHECLNYLKISVVAKESLSGLSSKDHHTRSMYLQNLLKDLEDAYKEGERALDALEIKGNVVEQVHQYLNDAANREKIFTWDKDGIPKGKTYDLLKWKASVAIREYISGAIRTAIENCKSELKELTEALSVLFLNITKKEAKMKVFFKKYLESDNELAQETRSLNIESDEENDLPAHAIVALVVTAPVWIPLGIAGLVTVAPVAAAVIAGKEHYLISTYRKKAKEKLEQWTVEILEKEFTSKTLERTIFEKLTQKINEKMGKVSKSITNYKSILKRLDQNEQSEAVFRGFAELKELCCSLDELLKVLQQPKTNNDRF